MSSTGVNKQAIKELKSLLEMVEDQQHMKNPQNVIDQLGKCRSYYNDINNLQRDFLDEVRFCLESGSEWGKGQ